MTVLRHGRDVAALEQTLFLSIHLHYEYLYYDFKALYILSKCIDAVYLYYKRLLWGTPIDTQTVLKNRST